jgi:hypothetical protein
MMSGENTIQVNGKNIHIIKDPIPTTPGIHDGHFTGISSTYDFKKPPPGLRDGVFTPVVGPGTGPPGLHNGVFTPVQVKNPNGIYANQASEALKHDGNNEKPAKTSGTQKAILIFVVILVIMMFIPFCSSIGACCTVCSLASGSGSIDVACTTSSENIFDNIIMCSQQAEDRVINRRQKIRGWIGEIAGPIDQWANDINGWVDELPGWETTIRQWSGKIASWEGSLDGGSIW